MPPRPPRGSLGRARRAAPSSSRRARRRCARNDTDYPFRAASAFTWLTGESGRGHSAGDDPTAGDTTPSCTSASTPRPAMCVTSPTGCMARCGSAACRHPPRRRSAWGCRFAGSPTWRVRSGPGATSRCRCCALHTCVDGLAADGQLEPLTTVPRRAASDQRTAGRSSACRGLRRDGPRLRRRGPGDPCGPRGRRGARGTLAGRHVLAARPAGGQRGRLRLDPGRGRARHRPALVAQQRHRGRRSAPARGHGRGDRFALHRRRHPHNACERRVDDRAAEGLPRGVRGAGRWHRRGQGGRRLRGRAPGRHVGSRRPSTAGASFPSPPRCPARRIRSVRAPVCTAATRCTRPRTCWASTCTTVLRPVPRSTRGRWRTGTF